MKLSIRLCVLAMFFIQSTVNFCFCQSLRRGPGGPVSARLALRKSAESRNLDELLDSLGTRDGGNYDIVDVRGTLSYGFNKSHSQLKKIINDDRIVKSYELLSKMNRSEAIAKIAEQYNKNFNSMKAATREGLINDSAVNYGLHALLFLTFSFDKFEVYEQRTNEWVTWFNDEHLQLLIDQAKSKSPSPPFVRAFERSASPELLMYVNLVAANHELSSITPHDEISHLEETLVDFGLREPLSELSSMKPVYSLSDRVADQSKAKALYEFPMFTGWGGLSMLNLQRTKDAFVKVRDIVVKPTARELLERDLEARFRKLLEKTLRSSIDRVGTTTTVFGLPNPDRQSWKACQPPTKKTFSEALARMAKRVPDSDREKTEIALDDVMDWLENIPAEGLTVGRKKVFTWYADSEAPIESTNPSKLEPNREAVIQISLRRSTTLTGKFETKRQKKLKPNSLPQN